MLSALQMLLPGACDGYLKFSEASTQIEEGDERWQKWVNLAQQGKSLYEWGLRSIDIGTALALCGDRPAVGAIGLGFRVLGLGFRKEPDAIAVCSICNASAAHSMQFPMPQVVTTAYWLKGPGT